MRGEGGKGRRERMEPDAEARRPKVQKDPVTKWLDYIGKCSPALGVGDKVCQPCLITGRDAGKTWWPASALIC